MKASIQLRKGKEKSLLRKHPWVFSGAVAKQNGSADEGDVIEIIDHEGNFLAKAHCQNGSICARVLTFENKEIDSAFWESAIEQAIVYRTSTNTLNNKNFNDFRLVHGEGDNLPGLIIDSYNGHLVIQPHTKGMEKSIEAITAALQKLLPETKSIYIKQPAQHLDGSLDGWFKKAKEEIVINEYQSQFIIEPEEGQKTGFFIDQRENRKLLADFAQDKEILNLFSYSGGFSLAALNHGAKKVVSVDSSEKAMALLEKNLLLNQIDASKHFSHCKDVFEFCKQDSNTYDIIIVDPPAFAKNHKALKNALQAYARINEQAFKKLRKGGMVFTFSCSQAVSLNDFKQAIFVAASRSNKNVRIAKMLSQGADHPISIYHPEGEYLKGLMLYVD